MDKPPERRTSDHRHIIGFCECVELAELNTSLKGLHTSSERLLTAIILDADTNTHSNSLI